MKKMMMVSEDSFMFQDPNGEKFLMGGSLWGEEKVQILEESPKFSLIRREDGVEGWISSKLLEEI